MIGEETTEQIKVVNWIRQCTTLPIIHVANERKCTPQHGIILKKMGQRSGVFDLFLPRSNGKQHGLWVEMKSRKGKPTTTQLDFMCEMISENYGAFVAYSADEAILIIKNFYSL